MTYYDELATVYQVRQLQLNSTSSTDDVLLLKYIREASHDIEFQSHRYFSPYIDTRYYDTPRLYQIPLILDEDLLELTTLTNGDSTVFDDDYYKVYPANTYPKTKIQVLSSSPVQWLNSNGGDKEQAISVLGVWGWHPDYTNAWLDSTAVLAAQITAAATTLTCTTGILYAGDLIKIDGEYIHISSVAVSATDTATIVRAVNGSTAAIHAIAVPIYRWNVYDSIAQIAVYAAVGYYNLRKNPLRDTIQLDNGLFVTPKDVKVFIRVQLSDLGIIRTGGA